MSGISATDVAIRNAFYNNKLTIKVQQNRVGGKYWAISDDTGLIEVATTIDEVNMRIKHILK